MRGGTLLHDKKIITDQADHSRIIWEVGEIKLVFRLDHQLAAALEFNHDQGKGLNQTESAGIEKPRVADRLQPGVLVRNQVTVVVETLADIAQVIPDTLGCDLGSGRSVLRGKKPFRRVFFQYLLVFIGNLVGGVGKNLVGHSADAASHRHLTGYLSFPGRASVIGRGPDVIKEIEVVIRLGAAGNGIAGFVQGGVADQPVNREITTGGYVTEIPGGIGDASVAPLVGQGELLAGQRPYQIRVRTGRIYSGGIGRIITYKGRHPGQVGRAVVPDPGLNVSRPRPVGGGRLNIGIDDEVVSRHDFDPQRAGGIGSVTG